MVGWEEILTRFVVWGAGKNGRTLLNLLKAERIAAFIDSNREIQNTEYKNIPIISYEKYKKFYIQFPVIIGPERAETEILELMRQDGIEWAFPFQENLAAIQGFLLQAPLERLTERYCEGETIYIYGFCPLGILMYDHFLKKGFRCCLLLQNRMSERLKTYINEKTEIKTERTSQVQHCQQRILLAMCPEGEDERWLLNGKLKKENYYDLDKQDLYFNPRIAKLKNLHEGESCFIVATGPSLKVKDLDTLYENQAVCISMNGIFKVFNQTRWRPEYYVLSDLTGGYIWKEIIRDLDVKGKFIADVAWNFTEDEISDNMYKWHFIRQWEEGVLPDFSDDFSRRAYMGYTVVYDGALQLAAYMGFRKIYLLGTDCCQYDDPQKQHFISNYSSEVSYLRIDKMMLAYQSAKRYAELHGIEIYNATRGGELEIFERVDFNSLF